MLDQLAALRGALADKAATMPAAQLYPRLRLLTTAELLCPGPPPAKALLLGEEAQALCSALGEAVRCRRGWLFCAVPQDDAALPVLVRPRLLQAAVLCVVQAALQSPAPQVVVRVQGQKGAALLCLHAGRAALPQDALPLLRRLARDAGGALVVNPAPRFGAVLRLPLAPGLALAVPTACEDLLADRYSLPYLYLQRFCAGAEQ